MQDVCISFWREDGRSDMMLKVTDICSTDPNDPTHCASPVDIKVDRTKANIMTKTNNLNDPTLQGDEYPEKVWWFFMKCWDDVRLPFESLLELDRHVANLTTGYCSTCLPRQQLVYYSCSSKQPKMGPVGCFATNEE